MPFIKVMIHYIWSTKNRQPIISQELRPLLLSHVKANSIKKGIFMDCLNCVKDHIHLLISLGGEQTIAKTAMLIKGESAVDKVRQYIAMQEEHHSKKTFAEEYDAFLVAHGLNQNDFG